jgi:CHAT domain-containing protein
VLFQNKAMLTKQLRFPFFHAQLSNYTRSITDVEFVINNRREADKLFYSSSQKLFDLLLKPVFANEKVTRLIIVPDDILSQLNFGTLITSPPDARADFREAAFVSRTCVISYAYASTLVMNAAVKVKPSAHRFAGFAPVYANDHYVKLDTVNHPIVNQVMRSGSLALPGAAKEVEWISDVMRGRSWLNEEATETNFKNNAKDYDVIHLAMHGFLNNDFPLNSELLFYSKSDSLNDGFLTVSEIYNLNLNSSLVVLSACSSGAGIVQRGEGAISLGRAFTFAGCESVVMSLWKVPDNVTNEIMRYFYEELLKGIPKDEALQAAQFRFLEETEDPTLRHPFFWAGFVLTGEASPISIPVAYLNYIIAAAVALAVLLLILKRKSIFPFHK